MKNIFSDFLLSPGTDEYTRIFVIGFPSRQNNFVPLLGLIGYPLSHSFSRRYFREHFARTGLSDWDYQLFPIESATAMPALFAERPELHGLNVTIPHKEAVVPLLHRLHPTAAAVGAVNTIKREGKELVGYNTDVIGFGQALQDLLGDASEIRALVLGTGGAAKAVRYVLEQADIPYQSVSRSATKGDLTYHELSHQDLTDHRLLINTTPLGMAPHTEAAPDLPYAALTSQHFLYDLIYNPAETVFLKHGIRAGATTANGLRMLELQAEGSWKIWNEVV